MGYLLDLLWKLADNIHSPSIAESQLVGGGPFPGTQYFFCWFGSLILLHFLPYNSLLTYAMGKRCMLISNMNEDC